MRSYDMKIAVLLWMLALGLAGSPLVAQNTAIPNDWQRVTVCELLRAPEISKIAAVRDATPEYEALQREVQRRTGQRISHFQGTVEGDQFTIGGPWRRLRRHFEKQDWLSDDHSRSYDVA
jgi:hypothetical protein